MPTCLCALPSGLTTVSHEFTVAAGRFAPGHLGELTQVVPFDLVDAVLDETRCVQRRLQDLPSRVGVYFLLAMCLLPEVGYRLVWQKLTAALAGAGLEVAWPTAKAPRDLRRRVGTAPMRRLFEVLAGLLAQPRTPGVRFGPFRAVSFDGCSSIKLPDSDRNVEWFGPGSRGGYPMLELMTLVETGTRSLVGAVFGPHQRRADRLRPSAAAPPGPGHAGPVGQRLRRQRVPRRRGRHRRRRSCDGSAPTAAPRS
ncbi:transposase domain-containing protein [Streptomyces acidicola]|uniref:transposase domain-containing protein n=1 Tax=Streptomyces acidicola TaxID=2596892 RepID=UPI00378C2BDE